MADKAMVVSYKKTSCKFCFIRPTIELSNEVLLVGVAKKILVRPTRKQAQKLRGGGGIVYGTPSIIAQISCFSYF